MTGPCTAPAPAEELVEIVELELEESDPDKEECLEEEPLREEEELDLDDSSPLDDVLERLRSWLAFFLLLESLDLESGFFVRVLVRASWELLCDFCLLELFSFLEELVLERDEEDILNTHTNTHTHTHKTLPLILRKEIKR